MAIRTTCSTAIFASPFRLRGVDQVLPAGRYQIDTDEEGVEGNDRTVFHRVATLIYVPTGSGTQVYTIDPEDLAAAIDADARS